ncbi:hypothetical protein D3C81_957670 [compost metagenome]
MQLLVHRRDEAVLDLMDGRGVVRQAVRGGDPEHPFPTIADVTQENVAFLRDQDAVDVSGPFQGHVLGVAYLRRLQRLSDLQFKALDELVLLEDRVRVPFLQAVVIITTTDQPEIVDVPRLTGNVTGQLVEVGLACIDRRTNVRLGLDLDRFIDRLGDDGVDIRNHWNWHLHSPCCGYQQ